jgi:hypothetical protein
MSVDEFGGRSVPTNLPERRVASGDQPISLTTQIGGFAVLLLATIVTVVMLDHANMSYASDGTRLVPLDGVSQWDSLVGFPP